VEIEAEILAYYGEGGERARLTSGPSLELLRTEVLLDRLLPAPPARVLDVGERAECMRHGSANAANRCI